MSKAKHIFALGACALIAAGCTSTPPEPQPDNIIPFEKTLDTVHTREDSVWEYVESRAGAAVRNQEMSHVLYNEHYKADPVKLALMEAERKAAEAAAQAEAQKAKAESEAAKKAKVKAGAVKRDKSIYSQKNRDKSIYAGTKSPAQPQK